MTMILNLLALNIVAGKKVSAQIVLLHNAGMAPKDIAKILNKTQSHVNTVLSEARKSKEANKDSADNNV